MCSAAAAFEVDERVSVRVIVSYPVFNLETIDWLKVQVLSSEDTMDLRCFLRSLLTLSDLVGLSGSHGRRAFAPAVDDLHVSWLAAVGLDLLFTTLYRRSNQGMG